MNKETTIIIIGTAHRLREPGKQAPDKSIKECVYSREICKDIVAVLKSYGYKAEVDFEDLDLPKNMQSANYTQERNRELAMRVNYVNEICRQNGAGNVIYVSVHLDAAGSGAKWMSAGGWSCFTSPGKTKADTLAECLYDAAERNLKHYAELMKQGQLTGKYDKKQTPIRKDLTDGDRDKEASYNVLTRTQCPAVLTENLFQDNKADVEYLLSPEGRHVITRIHVEGIINYIQKN